MSYEKSCSQVFNFTLHFTFFLLLQIFFVKFMRTHFSTLINFFLICINFKLLPINLLLNKLNMWCFFWTERPHYTWNDGPSRSVPRWNFRRRAQGETRPFQRVSTPALDKWHAAGQQLKAAESASRRYPKFRRALFREFGLRPTLFCFWSPVRGSSGQLGWLSSFNLLIAAV